MTVMRIEYKDPDTGTPREEATAHGESLVDMESYLLPLDQVRGSSLLSFGVAAGLGVRATTGQPGLTVAPGVALDGAGRLVVLAATGVAVVDPAADPDDPRNIPTVTVPAAGLRLESAGVSGQRFLTLRWLEVLRTNIQDTPLLLHAPWLRLPSVSGFQDDGGEVVLARVELDANGNVTGLSAEGRRSAGVVAGRVELRAPRVQLGPGLEQVGVGELRGRADGGVELALGSAGALRPALSVEPVSGSQARLSIQADTVVASRADGSVALAADIAGGSITTHRPDGATTLTLDIPNGRLGLGTPPLARLHAKELGGFGPDDAAGVLTSSNVPLLSQSDSTAVGALNADGRVAFALDIDHNNHTNAGRGVPTLCDFFDGTRHQAISLKQGRVGIGTQDPTEKLTVTGGGAEVNGVTVGTSVTDVSYEAEYESVGVGRTNFNLRLQSPNNIVFHTGGNPPPHRMLLDPSGKLRLGPPSGTAPQDTLEVVGTARLCAGTNPIRFTDSWQNFPAAARDRAEISNDTADFKTLMIVGNRSKNAGLRMVSVWDRLEVNGVSCANSFCNLSDARLKTDLEELAEPLEGVSRLRAVSFRWGQGPGGGGGPAGGGPTSGELAGAASIGVLAHEVAEVYPELVTTMGVDDYLGVNYQGLTAVLLEAVKELKAESERLRGRVDLLERRASAAPGA
jgi:Chaperone of endosialidase